MPRPKFDSVTHMDSEFQFAKRTIMGGYVFACCHQIDCTDDLRRSSELRKVGVTLVSCATPRTRSEGIWEDSWSGARVD